MDVKETMIARIYGEKQDGTPFMVVEDCDELKHAVRFILLYQAKRNCVITKYEIENCPLLK